MLALLLTACIGPPPTPPDPPVLDTDGSADADTDGPLAPSGDVVVHLFEWGWPDVATECERVLGPAGFAAVQVSPAHEHAVLPGRPWYERYQPVSYTLASRGGDTAAFADMVQRCQRAGVEIHVDAVLNHMAWGSGTGSGGTSYGDLVYPGHYGPEHFHPCEHGIEDWGSRDEIQGCRLATLPDLATERQDVRDQLTATLQHLLDLGVSGFRVDAAKHVPAQDLGAIFGTLEPAPTVFHEILALESGGVVAASEYTGLGRVTEVRYGLELTRVFREGRLDWLGGYGEDWGFLPSDDALVFIDNHDNQRGHGAGDPLTHEDGALYGLANVFMLAWPYGRPKLMSSYAIGDGNQGPPDSPTCEAGWICEHRWPGTLAMVGWRSAAGDAPVQHWWSNGSDQIAFARGDRAFVVFNREELPTLTETLSTGLPAGTYCDVLTGARDGDACSGGTVDVQADGRAEVVVGPLDAVALHVDARL